MLIYPSWVLMEINIGGTRNKCVKSIRSIPIWRIDQDEEKCWRNFWKEISFIIRLISETDLSYRQGKTFNRKYYPFNNCMPRIAFKTQLPPSALKGVFHTTPQRHNALGIKNIKCCVVSLWRRVKQFYLFT